MEENQQYGFSDLGFQRGKWGGDGNWFPETIETKRVNERVFSGVSFQKPKNPLNNGYRTDPIISQHRETIRVSGCVRVKLRYNFE